MINYIKNGKVLEFDCPVCGLSLEVFEISTKNLIGAKCKYCEKSNNTRFFMNGDNLYYKSNDISLNDKTEFQRIHKSLIDKYESKINTFLASYKDDLPNLEHISSFYKQTDTRGYLKLFYRIDSKPYMFCSFGKSEATKELNHFIELFKNYKLLKEIEKIRF